MAQVKHTNSGNDTYTMVKVPRLLESDVGVTVLSSHASRIIFIAKAGLKYAPTLLGSAPGYS